MQTITAQCATAPRRAGHAVDATFACCPLLPPCRPGAGNPVSHERQSSIGIPLYPAFDANTEKRPAAAAGYWKCAGDWMWRGRRTFRRSRSTWWCWRASTTTKRRRCAFLRDMQSRAALSGRAPGPVPGAGGLAGSACAGSSGCDAGEALMQAIRAAVARKPGHHNFISSPARMR